MNAPVSAAQAQLLQQAYRAITEQRWSAAEVALATVLNQQAGQPDALVLMAEVLRARGDLAGAEERLVRSLRAQPSQPHAWNRLAVTQEELGRLADAAQAFGKAIEFKPDHLQARYDRARLLRQLGQPGAAARCVNDGLHHKAMAAPPLAPLLAQMLQLKALLQDEAGQLEPALETLDEAVAAAPGRAALHHNRGVLLQRLSRPGQALAALDQALAQGLDAADAHYNRGNALQSLGRPADALTAYRAALARHPLHELALYDAARLRWRMGDADFADDVDAAAAAAPQSAVPWGIKGRLLLRADRYADAAAAFQQAAKLADSAPGYWDGLGQAFGRLGRFDDALAAHRRAVALAPDQAATHISHAGSLLQAGRLADADAAAATAVRLAPLDQQAWALQGLAWRALGDPREAWLNDHAGHVQVFDLAPPAGWADMASFNRALTAALAQRHTDAQAPVDQTLRGGSQTLGNLFDQGEPLVQQLMGRIAEAVDRYVQRLAGLLSDPAHPLVGRVAPRWRFTDSWSSRLRSDGFHTNHVHPHGWISSCYYVDLPPSVRGAAAAGAEAQAGWITFGAPDMAVAGRAVNVRRAVQPAVGRLVLFPSYMWHGTVPFVDDAHRLTVAFDVMPLREASSQV